MNIFTIQQLQMEIGVLKYPGGHGDVDLVHILQVHFDMAVREVWYKETAYADLDALFIGGGFPCRQGGEFQQCLDGSPALRYLEQFVTDGRYVIGFGNGFGLLCEAGLLPGALRVNAAGRYICRQVFITPDNNTNMITGGLGKEKIFRSPIATNYGRYEADEPALVSMRREGQIVFRYCDYEGRITEAVNDTGSTDNIAGVCNRSKTVFGMIPQPERAVTEFRREADGRKIIGSILNHLQA
jgi:phosphoribosylformylglycinamidine synthase subunit PurQ / glutaminase